MDQVRNVIWVPGTRYCSRSNTGKVGKVVNVFRLTYVKVGKLVILGNSLVILGKQVSSPRIIGQTGQSAKGEPVCPSNLGKVGKVVKALFSENITARPQ